MTRYASLFVGDPAPWFRQRCTTSHGDYTFDMTGGRYVVLYLFGSSADPDVQHALRVVQGHRQVFDDRQASFFGVSADPADEAGARLKADLPGIRHFFDADHHVGRLYGAWPEGTTDGTARNLWYVLDPLLRIQAVLLDAPGAAARIVDLLSRQPSLDEPGPDVLVPVLMLPDVFEPEFCTRLIDYYDRSDSQLSGVFTQSADGPSRVVTDTGFKRRRDCPVRDRPLVEQIQARIIRRVVPEIRKAYQFEATQLERLILASYDASDRGCFGAHRDNTVAATQHRRFAVSINLNKDFEGGELVFPEFSRRSYRPGAGGAIVFSCALLHLVTPVTAGRRLACLPFVYDEAAAKVKRTNAVAGPRPAGAGGI